MDRKGFYMVELSIIFAIISSLVMGGMQTYDNQISNAKDSNRILHLMTLKSGVDQYFFDTGTLKLPKDSSESFKKSLSIYVPNVSTIYDSKSGENCINSICDYVFNSGIQDIGYELSTAFEERKNVIGDNSRTSIDGGNDSNRYEVGNSLTLVTTYSLDKKLANGALIIK